MMLSKYNRKATTYNFFLKDGLITDVHDSLKVIFYINFKAYLEEVVFPEELKIPKVKPLLEKREKENV